MANEKNLIAATYFALLASFFSSIPQARAQDRLPQPGVGLLITRDDVPRLREKIQSDVPAMMWEWVENELPKALQTLSTLEYPEEPNTNTPSDVVHNLPLVAFHYLMTGDVESASVGRQTLLAMSRYQRIGWFTWDGGSFPHIGAGQIGRVLVTAYDWLYDALGEDDRAAVRSHLARAVEDFYRINLFVPGAPMHHFRSHNQGNNQFASALLGALALRGHHPDAERFIHGMVQTLSWLLTEHLGPLGQDLEADLGGYWMISVDALVMATVALRNVTKIDLTSHPHLRSLVDAVVVHLVPCPPVNYQGNSPSQEDAYDRDWKGHIWVQDKPASTPHAVQVGATFLFFALEYRDGRALELWQTTCISETNQAERFTIHSRFAQMPHIGLLGVALSILWYPDDVEPQPITGPNSYFTDRLGMIRTGIDSGDTYLLFNGGDLTLIANDELLGTCLGLVWHHPLYQYAKAQNTVWTEGFPIQPSYRIHESFSKNGFQYLSAHASTSNVYYYRKAEQETAYKEYDELTRDILSVSGEYFLILDRVEHDTSRAHTWVWHTLNTDHKAKIEQADESTVRIRRPKSDLYIHLLEPTEITFEQETQPLMPVWYFAWGDLAKALYARAGKDTPPVTEEKYIVKPEGWKPIRSGILGNAEGSVQQEIVPGPDESTQALRLTNFTNRPSLAYSEDFPATGGTYYKATRATR